MLGVHPNTVRAMFDRGELTGWVTPKGFRRIDLASVEATIAWRRHVPR